jgi:polyisoprenoid-binding protein YceI
MNWNLDPAHSSVEFAVRHMGIASVRGRFERFAVDVETDAEENLTGLTATIETASITTSDAQRDAHLRSEDFLDAERFPEIHFRGDNIEALGGRRYRIHGDLAMHGEVRPVTFDAELRPSMTDPWGQRRAAAEASGSLDRRQWGLGWNQVLEAGSLLVGEQVRFTLDVQAVAAARAREAVAAS